ncbi:transcriptional regulator [Saxibacter everestensis]|uniref:Transcriptional regulator n=1 Tax=Saxibacter everestensis TaxID=2909229 RepID=A0ABY8QYB0_9MICO|nr:transcriptional regulator [Brevibacteriaceae bacterium ZFBP1038]
MTRQSPPDLRILHATRLLGFGNSTLIAERAETSRDEAVSVLREAERQGWTQHSAFADLEGWSLTEEGRAENERQLARERASTDPENRIEEVHREFLPLNSRLLRACTDWQIKPTDEDQFAPNDHADTAWDQRILVDLAALSDALSPLIGRLSDVLARFGGYDVRFETARQRAQSGQHHWIDKTDIDSCHRVWFQFHEDLIATLGIDRGAESTAGS